jgi:hypothetical protein
MLIQAYHAKNHDAKYLAIVRGLRDNLLKLRPFHESVKALEMLNEIIAKHLNLLRFTILLHIIIRVVVIFEIYLCYPKNMKATKNTRYT